MTLIKIILLRITLLTHNCKVLTKLHIVRDIASMVQLMNMISALHVTIYSMAVRTNLISEIHPLLGYATLSCYQYVGILYDLHHLTFLSTPFAHTPIHTHMHTQSCIGRP